VSLQRLLKPVEKVYWVTDQDCTLVVNETRGETHRLAGLEQVIWDCLILGYGAQKMKTLIEKMGMVEAGAVDREMISIFREWERKGLVEIEEATYG
jgi:hypothetical protein